MGRALWKGSIGFGLVSIPVEMQKAVKEKKIGFHMVTPDGTCRLRQKLFCPDTGKEYDFSEAARGFEVAPDEIVVVDPDEIDALKPESGHLIEIKEFVDLSEIDPVYYDKSYVLIPGQRAERAYSLLHKAILDSGKVGIGSVVMREKQYFGVLRTFEDALLFNTIHYSSEIQTNEDFDLPKLAKTDKEELKLAEKLIESMSTKFKPEQFKNTYQKDLQKYLDKKAKGKTVSINQDEEEDAPKKGKVINLVDRLKSSLKEPAKKKKPAKKAPKGAKATEKKRKSA